MGIKAIISKKTLVQLLVIFFITAVLCWMWKKRSSQTLTHCIATHASHSTADTTKSSALTCGLPCTKHNNKQQYQELIRILDSYQTLHKSERENVIAGKTVKSLTWYCITGCGGIGDRMKKMYAAFLLALAMNRTFFIYQSEEVQKTMYTEPNAIDWRPVNNCIKLDIDEILDHFGRSSHWQHKILGKSENFSLVIDGMKHKQSVYMSKQHLHNLTITINQSFIAQENQPLAAVLLSLLQKDSLHCLQSIIHQYLFQVPQQVVREAASSLAMLNLHPQKFVSVHIRTGFMNSWFGEIVLHWKFFRGTRFARTQASWRGMIDCALRIIADSTLGDDSLLLVSSDEQEPKDWAVATYGARIRVLNIHPVHVSKQFLTAASATDQSFLQNWIELAVMAQSYAIVRIPSGFSDVASHMCSMSPVKLYTYSVADKWCQAKH